MTAFLEQMPPHRAVRRLELAREDLDRLGESGRVWAADAAIGLGPAAEPTSAAAPAPSAQEAPDPVIPVDLTEPAGSADDDDAQTRIAR